MLRVLWLSRREAACLIGGLGAVPAGKKESRREKRGEGKRELRTRGIT